MTSSHAEAQVLISGASIAGPALAYWLHRYGFRTTIVERASTLRLGGQGVDLTNQGRIVGNKMGIIELVKAKSTKEVGAVVVDDQDRTRASFGAGTDKEEAGITNELEILRGDLAQILVDQTKGKTEYMFGDRIESLQEDAEGINVRFASGSSRALCFRLLR